MCIRDRFYNGKYHKLGRVHFDLDTEYMKPWRLYDDEGRLDLTLTPCYDRTTRMKAVSYTHLKEEERRRRKGWCKRRTVRTTA